MGDEMEFDTRDLDELIAQGLSEQGPITATIYVDNEEAAKYWGVLDFGSKEGSRPWPQARKKTVEKDGRVFSKQAPGGFANKYFLKFLDFLGRAALDRIHAKKGALTRAETRAAVEEGGKYALRVIKAGVPIDSGKLASSIKLKIDG